MRPNSRSNCSSQINMFAAFLFALSVLFPIIGYGQESTPVPIVVQPGAPGQPTRVLPANTQGTLPPSSKKDIEFMRGMIMHHAQAVERTDMIESRTDNKAVRLLGARISRSQSDEMGFMKRWLETRNESAEMRKMDMPGHDMPGHQMLMPGMLTAKQMDALRRSKGAEFDRLFLSGMIQHHKGALVMVEELYKSPGTGQNAELFNFTSDVDTGQRAEISAMENLLNQKP